MVKPKSRPNCARTKPVAPTVEDQIDAALAAGIAPAAPQPVIPLPSFSPYELAKLAYGYDRRCDEIQDQISEPVKSAPSEPGKDVNSVVADGKCMLHRLRLEDQDKLWGERCRAVEDLVPLFPARTLGDAAVHLSYALRTFDLIHDEQSGVENAALAKKAERLVLWAFEAVASASERPLGDVMDLWPFQRLADAHGDFKRADAIGNAMRGSRVEQAPYYVCADQEIVRLVEHAFMLMARIHAVESDETLSQSANDASVEKLQHMLWQVHEKVATSNATTLIGHSARARLLLADPASYEDNPVLSSLLHDLAGYQRSLVASNAEDVERAFAEFVHADTEASEKLALWGAISDEPEDGGQLERAWNQAYSEKERAVENLIALPATSIDDLLRKAKAAHVIASDETSSISEAGFEGKACLRVVEDMLALMGAPC